MDPRDALQRHFGFDGFRPGQEEAVRAALAGHDVLVVMPTGAGKSLCYQLPALMRDDLTLVVSPLVSLMQDQVEGLQRVAPGRVGLVNAQASPDANAATLRAAREGALRLLYVAPERFSSPGFAQALAQDVPVGLFVVDEAHCVSQWGHDFRPDYFRLADAARYVGAQAIVASTATATPQVAGDIVRRLGLRDPARITTGFDRPNLTFAVVPCATTADKHARIAAALADPAARPAIVYAGTRAGSESLAARLREALGTDVLAYHAGLPRDARAAAQRRFMTGEVDVVVATNAFGMGVDKADVRTVCHESVPSSLEAYYQEAGRAGRDGRPSRALLFAESRDKGLHVFFIQRAQVDDGLVAAVMRRLGRDGERYDAAVSELPGDETAVRVVVGQLAQAGVLRPAPSTPDRLRGRIAAPLDGRARAACRAGAGEAERARWRQYRSIWSFVEGHGCRRAALLRHFGDRAAPAPVVPCCDVCAPSEAVPEAVRAPARPGWSDTATRAPRRRGRAPAGAPAAAADLDDAILAVVESASPAVGRTRAVEILRGGRSQVVRKYSYDGLPAYGAYAHLRSDDVLARVDALLDAGRLRSTGGAFPKLAAA